MFPAVALWIQAGATPQGPKLGGWGAYGMVALGIVISILLPIIKALAKPPAAAAGVTTWSTIRPYVFIGLLSLVAAVIVLAFAGKSVETWGWQNAVLAGYAWDSTLQKAGKG